MVEDSKKPRNAQGGLRSATRLLAVQVVYSAVMLKSTIKKAVQNFENGKKAFISETLSVSEFDEVFFSKLTTATEKHLEEIDQMISSNLSENWKFERLDNVTKAILRLGVTELLYFKDIPVNVVFNEYVEISKAFFEKNEVAFINGLLNSLSSLSKHK